MKKFIITTAIIGLIGPIIVWASDANLEANNVHIRSLAASCAACHGTLGNTIKSNRSEAAGNTPTLAGAKKDDIITKLQAFKSGERTATVMQRHAKGLTADEITALAEYFSAQVPHAPAPLTSQKLRVDHAN